ncbi:MAG: hypothetical protein WAU88_13785 [Candidatus Zixiibacteriota bacterium]
MSVGLALISGGTVRGQLSPGDLSHAHASLEGVQNCTKCHGSGRQLVPDKCLTCHSAIKQELADRTGMHGTQEYKECQSCHVEHQGREFNLIYWKDGEAKFDHSLTGYRLSGKHDTLACRSCHVEKFVTVRAALEQDKTTLSKTYLGLDTGCANCHADEHRGQFAAACQTCHVTAGWKPASGFDHAKSSYPLIGKHQTVTCDKCHVTLVDTKIAGDKGYSQFVAIRHDQCTDCHKDAHQGKLGPNCTSCHSPTDWHAVNQANFDHSKTRYPLEGKHIAVKCDRCHLPGRKSGDLKFAACRDCHSDFHKSAFADRPLKGACEECHTVAGYTPSRFLMAQHDSTKFALKAAHRAVPCIACHTRTVSEDNQVSYRFAFTSMQCLACHKDPHNGEVKKYVDERGCEYCHNDNSWALVKFDHGVTKFALDGKHAAVPCGKCHTSEAKGKVQAKLTFVGASTKCQDCHKDIHRGQFAIENSVTDCARCHTPNAWAGAEKFDHSTSRFKLDGAHKGVACQKCHRPTVIDEQPFVAYKPLDTACAACHDASVLNGKVKKS